MIKDLKLKSVMLIVGGMLAMTACNNTSRETATTAPNQEEKTTTESTSLFPRGEKRGSEWFSGDAYLYPLLSPDENNEFSMGAVTFGPGGRTHWHTHPKGQVLIVTEGQGWYQEKGKPAQIIKKGDVINIPEDVEHWHGASAHSGMTHIALTNFRDGENVTWLDPVTDEEFNEVNQ